jgi:lysine biosynthesis protein LysW
MTKGFCPECDSSINFGSNLRKGLLVTCPNCGAYLKVISESPIELDWADDDWDDYDEDEDFDDDD